MSRAASFWNSATSRPRPVASPHTWCQPSCVATTILLFDEGNRVAPAVLAAITRRFDVNRVSSLDGVRGSFDVALVAPGASDPFEACRQIRDTGLASQVIVLAEGASLRDALGALRAQATDFVPNGDDPEAVVERISAVLEERALARELGRLRASPSEVAHVTDLIGESPAMVQLRKRLERVVASDVTVLVTGESGSGKEVVARHIHARGSRRDQPFVAVNCSCIPRHLLESEFFGHVKGAFTDATRDRLGLLVQASGGSIFLDEIGDMPLELQAKLLRALQQRTVRPLGHTREVPFDARVIAATGKNLEREVMEGRFREDLYFRLNVLQVRVPPLRERARDVLLLAQHFIHRASSTSRPIVGLTPGAARALLAHSWPGNVRELEHCIVAAMANARHDHIRAADLPADLQPERVTPSQDELELLPLSAVEQSYILSVLKSVGGNRARASQLLGVDRSTLYRKLKQYGVAEAPRARQRQASHPD